MDATRFPCANSRNLYCSARNEYSTNAICVLYRPPIKGESKEKQIVLHEPVHCRMSPSWRPVRKVPASKLPRQGATCSTHLRRSARAKVRRQRVEIEGPDLRSRGMPSSEARSGGLILVQARASWLASLHSIRILLRTSRRGTNRERSLRLRRACPWFTTHPSTRTVAELEICKQSESSRRLPT